MVPERKFNHIQDKIQQQCESCSGSGCNTCRSKILRVKRYAKAGIPVDYWDRSWKNFNGDPKFKELVTKILIDLPTIYDQGTSYAFIGSLGTGKSYAACAILKMAIVNEYTVGYFNMSDVVELAIAENSGFFDTITGLDFICIDEFDIRHVYPSEKAQQLFGQTMERILRHRFQNKMPTIVCSNTADIEKVLSGDFSKSTDSLFANFMEHVYVAGKDYRKKVK